jgi:restriction system protein
MADITITSTNLENLEIGEIRARYSARGDRILRYYMNLRHKEMNLHKEVGAPELFILQSKVNTLVASWDEKFKTFQLRKLVQSGKEAVGQLIVSGGDGAVDLELPEHALDAIALLVERPIMLDFHTAI